MRLFINKDLRFRRERGQGLSCIFAMMNLDYTIEHTTYADLTTASQLFESAIAYQRENGFPIWGEFTRNMLKEFIEEKVQYKIIINAEIAMIFNATYSDKIIWRGYDQTNAVYLHHVAVNSKYKGLNLMSVVVQWSLTHAAEKQLPFLRLDTWGSNTGLIAYYQNLGFRLVEFFTTPPVPEIPEYYWGLELALFEMPIG